LLILDNFERVLPAAPCLVDLLESCLEIKFLVTSRQPLHLLWEHIVQIPPLALPDPEHLPPLAELNQNPSVALFVHRSQARDPEFVLTKQNARAVAELCVHLDGLPLALELAAARARLLSPQMILERLTDRFPLLHWHAQDLPSRQQTLHSAIAWSYDLLTEAEQTLFRHVGVFAGGFTLQAVEALEAQMPNDGPDRSTILDTLTSLADQSLMLTDRRAEDEVRYRLLESIQEYALDQLASRGEDKATRQAHATSWSELAARADPELHGADQHRWFGRLERDHANLRAAMRWWLDYGEGEHALRLAVSLGYFWWTRGYLAVATRYLQEALAQASGAEPRLRTRQGAPPLEIPGLTSAEHGTAGRLRWECPQPIREEVCREPVRRAPPREYPVSVLVLRSYAAQCRRSTDAAAGHDCRLPGQVSAGAVDYQGLLPRGLGGLPPLCRPAGSNAARPDCRAAQRRPSGGRGRAVLPALRPRFGIVVILKSRENARVAVSYPTPSGGNRIEVCTRFVWQYYFYLRDQDWGRMFLRICPYFPFNARVCVNQHERLACQLRDEGIFFRKAANAFVQCADPERLQQLADGLTPADLEVPMQGWLRELVPFYASTDPNRISDCVYRLFGCQVEYCTNLIFKQRAALDRVAERLLDLNRSIGRPDKLSPSSVTASPKPIAADSRPRSPTITSGIRSSAASTRTAPSSSTCVTTGCCAQRPPATTPSTSVAGNSRAIRRFRDEVSRRWHRVLSRRSQKGQVKWERMQRLIQRWIPPAHIAHPSSWATFAVMTQGKSPVP
jgi:predicted ATPase